MPHLHHFVCGLLDRTKCPTPTITNRSVALPVVMVTLLVLQNAAYALSVFLSMWTQGQVHVLNTGLSIELDCEFYAEDFNMFNNPVIWKKFQRQEQTDVNIMGNILPPFFTTGRFQVTLTSTAPRYRLRLKVVDLALEDSGNYTCEVRGPKSSIMAAVTHYIFVRAPVQSVYLALLNTSDGGSQQIKRLNQVTLDEAAPARLRCASVGGYPPPELSVFLGDRDVSEQFSSTRTTANLHGARGLRLMVHESERTAERLAVGADDDGLTLRCVASVAGLGTNSSAALVSVRYAPIIRCPPVSAYVGDKNVRLTCEVRARPGPTALFWLIDVNGTTVTEGVVIDEYWTLVMDRSDGLMETQLFMRQVTPSSFRTYTLYAENGVAVTTSDVILTEKIRPTTTAAVLPSAESRKKHYGRTAAVVPQYTFIKADKATSGAASSTHHSCRRWLTRHRWIRTILVTFATLRCYYRFS